MAKRRKLEAPSADDLSKIEQEFQRDTVRGPMSAPIAQVAADSAGHHDPRSPEERAGAARDKADAERLRDAEGRGLVILELPLSHIRRDALVRDRVVLDAEELDELKNSIAKGGLRLPIEVFETPEDKEYPYGLLSGYRRLIAMQQLHDMTQGELFGTIKAVVRDPDAMGGPFAAMIEENEIRSSLSHYERGRISVIAVQKGAFVNTEEAVNALFAQASKAKRSKVRSFALIFEELGDMLRFPDLIREKDGLRLAAALRDGAEAKLRAALDEAVAETPQQEELLIREALEGIERRKDPKRGGRPKKVQPPRRLPGGTTLQSGSDDTGWYIRLNGRGVNRELVEMVMGELERLLAKSGG